MELGIRTLGDLQRDVRTGRRHRAAERTAEALGYAELADQLGPDVFAVGEHHTPDFATSSPAVLLAAVAARTSRIRLTSAVTLLGVLDPVRVYQDFATVDLISRGRAELTVGRSAFVEPFALFGQDTAEYDQVFAEKLDLLLQIRDDEHVTWSGRYRPPLTDATVIPRAVQHPLPVWVGVGGTVGSAERAGRLGLPMTLGHIGGTLQHLRPLADAYRAAGERAGHLDQLRLGISTHLYVGADPAAFEAATSRTGATMVGGAEELTTKLLEAKRTLGLDRLYGQIDWGGLPAGMVEESGLLHG